MEYIKKVPIKQFNKGEFIDKTDSIIEEKSMVINIDDLKVAVKLLPENAEYFVYGYLLTNFFISDADDVAGIEIAKDEIKVKLKKGKNIPEKFELVSSCFSSGEVFSDLAPVKSEFEINPEIIIDNTSEFLKLGKYFVETGCTHIAALFLERNLVIAFEDIGRHNAIDKIAGYILKENVKIENHMIFTTGRISTEIVKKVIVAKVPVLVSRSAVTCAAMNMALKYNLKVIGFSRNRRFNLYT